MTGGQLARVCLVDRICQVSQNRVSLKCGGSRHDLSHFYTIMEQFCCKAIPSLGFLWCVRLSSMRGNFVYMNH
jgi:hypothetical protein